MKKLKKGRGYSLEECVGKNLTYPITLKGSKLGETKSDPTTQNLPFCIFEKKTLTNKSIRNINFEFYLLRPNSSLYNEN